VATRWFLSACSTYDELICLRAEVVQNATGPLLVEIDKLPGNPLGITLTQGCYRGRRVLYIDSVASASIADRSVIAAGTPALIRFITKKWQ